MVLAKIACLCTEADTSYIPSVAVKGIVSRGERYIVKEYYEIIESKDKNRLRIICQTKQYLGNLTRMRRVLYMCKCMYIFILHTATIDPAVFQNSRKMSFYLVLSRVFEITKYLLLYTSH